MKSFWLTACAICCVFSLHAQSRVTDIHPSGDSDPKHLTVIDDHIYFSAYHPFYGEEAYVIDSSETTTALPEIVAGTDGSSPESFIEFQEAAYFLANKDEFTRTLYTYQNGTITELLSHGTSPEFGRLERDGQLDIFQNQLVFSMSARNFSYGFEPYAYSNGDSIQLLADVNPNGTSSNPSSFTEMGGKLYFLATGPGTGRELWVYDPDSSQAQIAVDLKPGFGNGFEGPTSTNTTQLVAFQNHLYFVGWDGVDGSQIFKFDGTNAPTALMIDGQRAQSVSSIFQLPNQLAFSARNHLGERALYTYDGTAQPTHVSDTPIYQAKYFRDGLMFMHDDDIHGEEMWYFDGVSAPYLLADIYPGSADALNYGTLYSYRGYCEVDGVFYFTADDGVHGRELWKFDGKNAPELVHDLNPGLAGSSPAYFVEYRGALYVVADDGSEGTEIWKFKTPSTTTIESNSLTFNVYPNPTENMLVLKTDQPVVQAEVLDLNGKRVMKVQGQLTQLNCSHLAAGTYVVRIKTVQGSTAQTLFSKF
ncbi:T9SS type A sorting domain-containing protein [Pontibacter sp. G13]|uniref:T9SS type A sorting domain-containing protein n=1 Tax=Pontibacter sp. G13 TaxID=3074898 RepID=UPI00288BF312|nr:T9SS type A sorting domain-containing protein [Pontibacter sp. G13]WNJ17697.1 T9SS type A sorting domain-containing protein [Pontibacter sp. G13]